jgi:hypothetical protein
MIMVMMRMMIMIMIMMMMMTMTMTMMTMMVVMTVFSCNPQRVRARVHQRSGREEDEQVAGQRGGPLRHDAQVPRRHIPILHGPGQRLMPDAQATSRRDYFFLLSSTPRSYGARPSKHTHACQSLGEACLMPRLCRRRLDEPVGFAFARAQEASYGGDLNFSEASLTAFHNCELADVLVRARFIEGLPSVMMRLGTQGSVLKAPSGDDGDAVDDDEMMMMTTIILMMPLPPRPQQGNLVQRAVKLSHLFCEGVVSPLSPDDPELPKPFDAEALRASVERHFAEFSLERAAFAAMDGVRKTNK